MKLWKLLSASLALLPACVFAGQDFSVTNYTGEPSTVKITSGALFRGTCSSSPALKRFIGEVGTTQPSPNPPEPGPANLIPWAGIKVLCQGFITGDCEADVFMNGDCSGEAVGHATLTRSGEIATVSYETSGYRIEGGSYALSLKYSK